MRLSVARSATVTIVRVDEPKLTYPVLAAFYEEVRRIVADGARRVLLDLRAVTCLDSPSIGCLMDLHRLLEAHGGALKLSPLQPRVETMLRMTGVHRILEEGEETAPS